MKYLHVLLLFFFFQISFYDSMSEVESFNDSTDREALIDFKLKVTDPQNALSGWAQNSSHCTWYGVSCNNTNGAAPARVQSLNLTGLGLSGALPPYLSNLTFLRVLDLSNNSFHGHIPFDFGRFLHIRRIKLASNSINGTIPVGLSSCHDLRTLELASNRFSGNLPPELGLLKRLKIFDVSVNDLSGTIPPSFGNLSSLTYLALARNHLVGEIPSQLDRLHNLLVIQFSENHLSGYIPSSIFNISSLVFLSVTKNNLSGKLPNDNDHALPNLKEISMAQNWFEGVIPSSLSNASQINSLDLSFNNFKGFIPLFENMNKLIHLDLGNNSLSSNTNHNFQLFDSLRNCTELQVLKLFGNQLAGELPGSVANLSILLQQFCVDDNMLTGGFPQGVENFPNLISLSMEMNSLTGEIPKSLGMLNKLQRLTLHQNMFYGEIPDTFSNWTQLYLLTMGNNQFSGRIPPSIGACRMLNTLGLRANRLNGSIAKEIFRLSSLSQLRLSQNSLSGPIPSEVGNLKQLQFMDVSDNQLSGNLSTSSIGSCVGLHNLLMARNNLAGSIPHSIGNLASLVSLDLCSNNLSGPIPEELGELEYLVNLNLSLNHLEGEVPTGGVFKNLSSDSFLGNTRLCGDSQEIARKLGIPLCITKKKKRHILLPIIASVAGFTLLTSLVCTVLWALNSRKKNNKSDKSSSPFSPVKGSLPMVSYYDILGATNNFAADNLIGKGGFGSVFKGNFSTGETGAYTDVTTLAVKVLDLQLSKAPQSFIAECEALRNVRHRNLVKIVTSCSSIDHKGDDFKALVMDFMSNGNLDQWLYPKDAEHGLCLTLLQRLNIVIDVASAMDYLHHDCNPPVVHCDLKPGNVLLDDDMVAHVGDFGLARFISQNPSQQESSTTGLKGSIGYIAPEYGLGGKASTSGDVYSFGILLLEIMMARKPTDEMFKEGLSLHKFASKTDNNKILDIVDPRLFKNNQCQPQNTSNGYSSSGSCSKDNIVNSYWLQRGEECVVFVIRIGLSCAAQAAKDRITMRETLTKLQEIKKFLLSL
ncbi:hypothetical protein JRO89_XS07G0216500 [Xanthoceras sorbifolium]|uniref:non-specific serine/threonine protein kinase n=1 Tax=Xanthoceras sorbifolium TaxID=99658 RepID=A0ABQ8HUI8_9ROSI|nr:hypothetical protein JRO89_XS07G0216500 [Xanthoceras sorbifolium]